MFEPVRGALFGQRRQEPVGRNMVLLGGALAIALGAALAAPNAGTALLKTRVDELRLVSFSSPLVAPVETELRMPAFRDAAPAPGAIGLDVEHPGSAD